MNNHDAIADVLKRGVVIPALPLALNKNRKLDERRQRALIRYYLDAGAGGELGDAPVAPVVPHTLPVADSRIVGVLQVPVPSAHPVVHDYGVIASPTFNDVAGIEAGVVDERVRRHVHVLHGASEKARIVAPQAVMDLLSADLKAKCTSLANGARTELLGIGIEAIAMYNMPDPNDPRHPKGRGNGYVLTFGNERICRS